MRKIVRFQNRPADISTKASTKITTYCIKKKERKKLLIKIWKKYIDMNFLTVDNYTRNTFYEIYQKMGLFE